MSPTATELLDGQEVAQYNRALLRMTEWYSTQNGTLITYYFHFQGRDDRCAHGDCWTVVRPWLFSASSIEKIWNEIAEQNSRHFVRGDLVVVYPHCELIAAGEF